MGGYLANDTLATSAYTWIDQLCGSHTRRTVNGQKDNMRLMWTNVQAASLNENERRQIGVRHKNH